MAIRYCGGCVIRIKCHDAGDYRGSVTADGKTWHFDGLKAPLCGFPFASDSPEAYDQMAESAIGFGSYYTTDNRGDETPEWANPVDAIDAISDNAVSDDQGTYIITRKKG
jgi:hypothetical protein